MFGHGETDADQQDAGGDHQRRHDDHRALHPPVSYLQRVERLAARQRRAAAADAAAAAVAARQSQLEHDAVSGRGHVHSWFSTRRVAAGVDGASQLVRRQCRHHPFIFIIVVNADADDVSGGWAPVDDAQTVDAPLLYRLRQ